MTTATKTPRAYRPGLWTRLSDGFRYGGGVGQWSWFFHRVTGLGILLFLIIHIVDTFLVVAYPSWYDHTVGIYGGMVTGLPWAGLNGYYWLLRWGFRLGELGLIACVVFHAINGVRVVLVDFWPGMAQYQRESFRVVMGLFLAIMLVVTIVVVLPLTKAPNHWHMPEEEPAAAADPGR